MGLILVGDFLQLPPVTENFKSPLGCSNQKLGEVYTERVRLQTQYRHTNGDFIKGLNLLRAGRGGLGTSPFTESGRNFPACPTTVGSMVRL